MRLSELRTGEKGVIVKVLGHGGFRKRIVEMGFIKGKTVEVILNAPLKDPIKYRLLGYEISLRRQEADMIEVISEQEARTMQNPYHGSITEDVPVSESELVALAKGKRRTINVALVGNPNCGKTSLFNIASGAHEHVGNYSGVTVDAKEGFFDFQGYHFRIVDLPGTYSLSAYTPEELYVRKHIIEETPDVIINVADSSNLERNFYLTTQLIDMNVRMVIALNMYDELESSGNKLDYIKLSQLIGVPMIPTVCRRGEGIDQLFHVIIGIYEGGDFLSQKGEIRSEILEDLRDWHKTYVPDHEFGSHKEEEDARPRGYMRHIHINHGPELERSIEEVKKAISQNEDIRHKYSTRFLSIKLLENDKEIENFISTLPNGKEIIAIRNKETLRIRKVMNEDSEQAITDAKYGFITGALKETFTDNHLEKEQTTRVIDSIVTHRIWGYPIFFLFLYIMFEGTFVLGDYPMQGIEWLVDQLGNLIRNNMAEGPLKDLLIDGIIGDFERIGATIMANACGPCIGQWKRHTDDNTRKNSIVTSFNRNFAKRADGNPNTHAFVASPELTLALTIAGDLCFNPLTDTLKTEDGKVVKLKEPKGSDFPPKGFEVKDNGYLAPTGKNVVVNIDPESNRLQALKPFAPWNGEDFTDMPLLIKAEGKCTTDHISMAGPWLRFRGHLENISDNMLMGAVNAFNGKTNSVLNQLNNEYEAVSAVAKQYKANSISSIVVAEENYGEGSSREHAAMEPRFLNVKVILAKSFARIHETNLKKQGMLALTFANKEDYSKIRENDHISIIGLKDFQPGKPLTAVLLHADGTQESFPVNHTYNDLQIKWFKAGSALNTAH